MHLKILTSWVFFPAPNSVVMRQFLKGVKPENTEGCTKPTWETVFCVGVFGGTCLSI